MNAKKFSEAMSELDAKYVDEAINYKRKTKKPVWAKWGAVAACLCLVLSGGFLYQAENRYPMKEVASTNNGDSAEIYTLPHWEDMEIYNQYPQIIINELEYQANWGEVSASQLGVELGKITAYGWDEYANIAGEDAIRYCNAAIYEIQNISAQCAVAVQYEGTSAYYAAVNNFYHPDTLGEFIEDINLKDTLIVNWASYEYHKPISKDTEVRFENVDISKVFDLLLSNGEAVNEYSDFDNEQPEELLDICVSVPILGYENISLSVREEGYIITNILSTGKKFFVGEENTQAFVDYVLKECSGYEVVYTLDPDEVGMPHPLSAEAGNTG